MGSRRGGVSLAELFELHRATLVSHNTMGVGMGGGGGGGEGGCVWVGGGGEGMEGKCLCLCVYVRERESGWETVRKWDDCFAPLNPKP